MSAADKRGGHVVRLQAENVKRLRAVDISPAGSTVVIRGNNAQGKTSVLDAIELALGGKGAAPPKVIREGQTAAKVVLELEDLVVERRWTANDKSTLEVRSKEGAKYSSPQAMLDRLVVNLSFDPLAFMREKPEAQARTLARLVGIDLVEHEAQRRAIFDQRTTVNRELRELEARLSSAAPKPAGDPKPVDPKTLLDEMGRLMECDRQRSMAERVVDAAAAALADGERQLARVRSEIAKLEEQLAFARETAAEWEKGNVERSARLADARKSHEAWTDPAAEMQQVRDQLAGVEKTNALARQAAEHGKLAGDVAAARSKSEALTQRIEKLDEDRAAQMQAATMPVPGLAIAEGALVLNGIPLEQASSAEQLTVSVAMGLALNPKLRVLLVRDGSLLDKASMVVLEAMAAQAGAQVWIEVVGDEGVGVVIEDGAVRAAPAASGEPAQKGLGL